MKWEVLDRSRVLTSESLFSILLNNRGIKTKKEREEFVNPTNPSEIKIEEIGVTSASLKKVIERIKEARKKKEFVVVYGDYDADGITATGIVWETLHDLGLEVLPFIPDRFEDGYGIKPMAVEKLKNKFPNLSLIITVDNGIVADEGVAKAKDLGIDVVVVDHHQKGIKKLSTGYILHTTSVCGSALAWFLSRELCKSFHKPADACSSRLELAAIGTIADQMPLIGINRSVVKFGLKYLNKTKRPGFLSLFKEAGIKEIGQYEVGFIIAPRINSMGRLKNGLESLRLICTKDKVRAMRLSNYIGKTNLDRQKIVDEVIAHALDSNIGDVNVIVLSSTKYHEGVIGLAAAKLVEKFYRPAIVISEGEDISKASGRSIAGFNIIEAIREVNLHMEGGGHPMAAGFSIKTEKIKKFEKEINKYAKSILTPEILQKRLKIDCKIDFDLINDALVSEIVKFEPVGLGNSQPVFETDKVEVLSANLVGRDARHIKLRLKQNEHVFDSIFFGGGEIYSKLLPDTKIDVAYSIEENIWNGYRNIQLKIKDIAI